jgi:hypothetical protein
MKPTTHLKLLPRSIIRGSIHSLPLTPLRQSVSLAKHGANFTFYLANTIFYRLLFTIGHDGPARSTASRFTSFGILFTDVWKESWDWGSAHLKASVYHMTIQTHKTRKHTSTLRVGFEIVIPVFTLQKRVHASDSVATAIGLTY